MQLFLQIRCALTCAASVGKIDVVNMLLRAGAHVNSRGAEGITPLIAAANIGSCAVMHTLIRHGASLDQADDRGHTPLYHCLGHRDAVMELLAAGAVPTEAVLDHAARTCPPEVVDALRAAAEARGKLAA